jgi:hypothetical protein
LREAWEVVVEVCVNLTSDAVDLVTEVARADNVSQAEAMRRLLSYGKFVHQELVKGHEILVENAKGPGLWRVTFPAR